MRPMKKRTTFAACACCALVLAACGGANKQADSASNCPPDTVLKGSDCVADDSSGSSASNSSPSSGSSDTSASSGSSTGSASSGTGASGATKPATSAPPSGGGIGTAAPQPSSDAKASYDKEAVEVQLKRAERQIKANCGSATDEEGKATGPWGATTATVTLGRNGRVLQSSVPAPYDGKPVGTCVVHAYQKIVFPPYPGSADATVTRDVEITQPKH